MKRRRHLTDEQLIELLQAEAERLGYTPVANKVGLPGSLCPVQRVYRDRFGTWADACRMAGLPVRKRGETHYHSPLARPVSRIEQAAASKRAKQRTAEIRAYWEQRDPALKSA